MELLDGYPELREEVAQLLQKFRDQKDRLMRRSDVEDFQRRIEEAPDVESKSELMRHLIEENVPGSIDLLEWLLKRSEKDPLLHLEWLSHRQDVAMSVETFVKAREIAEQAHDLAKKLYLRESPGASDEGIYKAYIKACVNLLLVCRHQGQISDAEGYLDEAQKVAESEDDTEGRHLLLILKGDLLLARGKALSPFLLEECLLTSNRGLLLQKIGNFYRSLFLWGFAKVALRQSISIADKLKDSISKHDCMTDLGNVYRSEGRIADALKYQLPHMAFAFQRGDLWGLSVACFNMGLTYYSVSPRPELKRALVLLSLSHDLSALTGNEPLRGMALNNLGKTFCALGQYERGVQVMMQSVDIAQKIQNVSEEEMAYGNIGTAYRSQGKYDEAIENHNKYLENALARGDLDGVTTMCKELAIDYLCKGNLESACEMVCIATVSWSLIRLGFDGRDTSLIAYCDKKVSEIYSLWQVILCQLKKYAEALMMFELGRSQALTALIRQKMPLQSLLDEPWMTAETIGWSNTSDFATRSKAFCAIISMFNEMLPSLKKSKAFCAISSVFNEMRPSLKKSKAFCAISSMFNEMLPFNEKSKAFCAIISMFNEMLPSNEILKAFCAISSMFHEIHPSNKNNPLSEVMTTALEQLATSERSQFLIEDIQADILLSAQDLRTNFLMYSVVKEYDKDGSAHHCLYIWLVLDAPLAGGKEDRIHFRRMVLSENIQSELLGDNDFFSSLKRSFAAQADGGVFSAPKTNDEPTVEEENSMDVSMPEGPEVKELLQLLEFPSISDEKVIKAATTSRRADDSHASEQETGVDRADIILERILEPGSWSKEGKQQLEQLYDLCVAPVADLLPEEGEGGSVPRLTIVTDGFLSSVPFCCLLDRSRKDKRYLVERFEISYAPSLRALHVLNQRLEYLRNRQSGREMKVLAMGHAVMSLPDIKELPSSGEEAQNVQEVFGPDQCRLALQEDATKQLLLQELKNVDILHVATHASPQDIEGQKKKPAGDYSMRGCLLLSKSGERCNGVVKASEIASIVDCRCQLVTLSCCETGLGKVTGDGVVGLYRAFFAAGAASVLVTLWKIRDDVARLFMEHFYKEFKETGSVSGSLRSAMVYCIQEKDLPPQQWAAFSHIGAALGSSPCTGLRAPSSSLSTPSSSRTAQTHKTQEEFGSC